jgi:hypothetical protein
MTILYKGIRRKTTDVLDDYGQAFYMQNVRLKRVGEMGRRAGLGKSTMAQLAGPVQFMIGGWSNEPFIVNGTGGDVTGNANPLAYWTGATMRIPDGEVGQPQAPFVNGVLATPLSPQNYVVGQVLFTPDITYDGLSGPLLYQWFPYNTFPNITPPFVGADTDPTATFDFNASCTDGMYTGMSVTVTTTIGGLTASSAPGMTDFEVLP